MNVPRQFCTRNISESRSHKDNLRRALQAKSGFSYKWKNLRRIRGKWLGVEGFRLEAQLHKNSRALPWNCAHPLMSQSRSSDKRTPKSMLSKMLTAPRDFRPSSKGLKRIHCWFQQIWAKSWTQLKGKSYPPAGNSCRGLCTKNLTKISVTLAILSLNRWSSPIAHHMPSSGHIMMRKPHRSHTAIPKTLSSHLHSLSANSL